ncbi:sirohydrochlorin chelatase [Rivibacter subsaxonicus]|uniref:Sirohydrochlorin cobaltochelatase n=1 Tax=Rivibacter subsaxonicus TaxID=457575 RepID=A0A4Q7VD89_9BURK|nr:CbiX/SirB N-terminal domain-containing protein [Rivibacter subsaxonicus]RZT93867.1 sirohydrochlorin cobaltochelatase [Rivibacter subsaxonicus]
MSAAARTPSSPGILLFAHGARDPNWALPFEAVAARVRALRPGAQVRLAFLELMSPGLAQAGEELVAAGCVEITVVPLFLGAGGHVRKDLPALVQALATAHPGVQVRLRSAVGEDPIVIEALAAAAAQDPTPAFLPAATP